MATTANTPAMEAAATSAVRRLPLVVRVVNMVSSGLVRGRSSPRGWYAWTPLST